MHSVDHLFALLIVVVYPVYEVFATRSYLKEIAANRNKFQMKNH